MRRDYKLEQELAEKIKGYVIVNTDDYYAAERELAQQSEKKKIKMGGLKEVPVPVLEGGMVVQKVEVHFPIPVELSKDFERGLMQLVSTLCEGYEAGHPDRVMWPASEGSKMLSLNEPLFDDTIYCIGVMERGRGREDLI